jgi:hypothetical protein
MCPKVASRVVLKLLAKCGVLGFEYGHVKTLRYRLVRLVPLPGLKWGRYLQRDEPRWTVQPLILTLAAKACSIALMPGKLGNRLG